MQLHYLLVVAVSCLVMSSTVVIFAVINYSPITRVVNNYYLNRTTFLDPNRTKLIPNRIQVFKKNWT